MSVFRRALTTAAAAALALGIASPALAADTTPPTGVFSVDHTQDYVGGVVNAVAVTVTRMGVSDDTSSPANITQEIDPGDGSGYVAWGPDITHQLDYIAAGTYHPTVRLTDEAGNPAIIDLPTITVTMDSSKPTIHIAWPSPAQRSHVRAWPVVHGTAFDTGSGARTAIVIVLERRAGIWYGYDYSTRRWSKGYANLQKTLTTTDVWPAFPDVAAGKWQAPRIAGLRKGTLLVQARSYDKVGNLSAQTRISQVLTKA
ncbi:hypothetical protein GCM10028801_17120 [Nocardioides maradonensis]